VDLMMEEEERRRRLWSVVVMAEPSPYIGAAATVGQMGSRQCGPSSGGGGCDRCY
jgi:hypothetical protein